VHAMRWTKMCIAPLEIWSRSATLLYHVLHWRLCNLVGLYLYQCALLSLIRLQLFCFTLT
jgi:hypothetical protein